MKKYFSVDIYEESYPVKIHSTLEDAKQACLKNAENLYEWACDRDCMDEYESRIQEAVYGVVMGQAESQTRPLNQEEKECSWYDEIEYIIERPQLVAHNNNCWISVNDQQPNNREHVLCFGDHEDTGLEVVFIGYKEGSWYSTEYGELGDAAVKFWQPLPTPPVNK
jgi:hypothetical protein|nr:MAG TPA: Protein of unknown function (DUF551) [Caudoviricetes sp.]